MFCRNCGSEMHEEAVVCVKCGVPKGSGNKFCDKCGAESHPDAVVCINCGCSFGTPTVNNAQTQNNQPVVDQKSKLIAGLLGIFLGALGVHNFYLGFTKKAVTQLVITLAGSFVCGIGPVVSGVWGLVEGIQILSSNNKTDADGNPLKND